MAFFRDPAWQFAGVVVTLLAIAVPIFWELIKSKRPQFAINKGKVKVSHNQHTEQANISSYHRVLLSLANDLHKEDSHLGLSSKVALLREVANDLDFEDIRSYCDSELYGWGSYNNLPSYRLFKGIVAETNFQIVSELKQLDISPSLSKDKSRVDPEKIMGASPKRSADISLNNIKSRLKLLRTDIASRMSEHRDDVYDVPITDKLSETEGIVKNRGRDKLIIRKTHQAFIET